MDVIAQLGASISSLPFLVTGMAGSLGVLGGALALGIRHGMDWDHIAAITDITSTTTADETPRRETHSVRTMIPRPSGETMFATVAATAGGGTAVLASNERQASAGMASPLGFLGANRRSLTLATLYALGHGSMVIFLGLIAILFSGILPSWLDPVMEVVVGVTLVFLGVYLLYSLYGYLRNEGEFRLRSRWMLVFAGVRRLSRRIRRLAGGGHAHPHPHPHDESQQYGVATSYGIGLIHGIGAETGTQVLIIATAVGAASTGLSIATLFVFVTGLLLSNAFIALLTATGFASAGQRKAIYASVGGVAAVFSLGLGLLYLTNNGSILPDLDPYFRWVGGPVA